MTVQFKSILCKELSDFLGFREKTLSKSAYCHDRLYLQRLDKYLCSGKYSTKELSEECLTGWINTLSGKTVTIANEVIVIRLFLEFFKSHPVTAGKVVHMNIIADTGSVRGVIVVSEHKDVFPLSERRFHHHGDEIRRIPFQSGKAALDIITGGIEIFGILPTLILPFEIAITPPFFLLFFY